MVLQDLGKEYKFLKEMQGLTLVGLGGSHAYGTNIENSDLDLRGIALNSKEEILLGNDFSQIVDTKTDTTIYSFRRMIELLSNCNPNTIEILGLKKERYLVCSSIGEELLAMKEAFLSKKAAVTFGGYANAQLRRLDNKSARDLGEEQREQHVLNSIKNASINFKKKYLQFEDDSFRLYVGDAVSLDREKELLMDIHLTGYPLRDYSGMMGEIHSILRGYDKIGKRNRYAVVHDKISKHMMHLIRLYYMCFDILEKHEINTYREKEHDVLMCIRNGDFLNGRQPIPEFFEMVDELEKRLQYDAENTDLPEEPDSKRIREFVMSVNERIVKDDIFRN